MTRAVRFGATTTNLKDHADAVVIGTSATPPTPMAHYASGSDEGFMVFDARGQMLERAEWATRRARAWGIRPDAPRPATHGFEFLEEPRHHHALRSSMEISWPRRADPFRQSTDAV